MTIFYLQKKHITTVKTKNLKIFVLKNLYIIMEKKHQNI